MVYMQGPDRLKIAKQAQHMLLTNCNRCLNFVGVPIQTLREHGSGKVVSSELRLLICIDYGVLIPQVDQEPSYYRFLVVIRRN